MRIEVNDLNIRRVLGMKLARLYLKHFLKCCGTKEDAKQIAALALLEGDSNECEHFQLVAAASKVKDVFQKQLARCRAKPDEFIYKEPDRDYLLEDPFNLIGEADRDLVRDAFYTQDRQKKYKKTVAQKYGFQDFVVMERRVNTILDELRPTKSSSTSNPWAWNIRPIPGFPDYGASFRGHIYSFKNGKQKQLIPSEYMRLTLMDEQGHKVEKKVADFILLAWRGPQLGRRSRHLDGNIRNNKLNNLAWKGEALAA